MIHREQFVICLPFHLSVIVQCDGHLEQVTHLLLETFLFYLSSIFLTNVIHLQHDLLSCIEKKHPIPACSLLNGWTLNVLALSSTPTDTGIVLWLELTMMLLTVMSPSSYKTPSLLFTPYYLIVPASFLKPQLYMLSTFSHISLTEVRSL